MAETKREFLNSLKKQVKQEREKNWDEHYKDLARNILPRRSRFLTEEHNDGSKKYNDIIDNAGTRAARTLRAGLHSGSTNPARPWFRLATPDPDLMEFGAVKEWLYIVERRMRDMFLRSNLYNALPILYGDIGVYATGAMGFVEDVKGGLRFYPFPVGSYSLANNDRLVVDTLVRELKMTVRQIVNRFGDRSAGPGRRWENFSDNIKNLWDKGHYEQTLDIVHCVYPNHDFDPRKLNAKNKSFASAYFETSAPDGKFLRESGFDEFPVLAPRWEVTGEDVYGSSSPGMEALGDIKALQILHKRKAEAIEKMVRPPMGGPSSLRGKKVSLLPGDVSYFDVREGQKGLAPLIEVNPRVAELVADIQDHRERISSTFYEDLFAMLAISDRRQITAREIEERHEEKLIMLSPVTERLYDELHDPLIDRSFNIMVKRGEIPPPPQELVNVDLKVEYISIMAQAQKAVATASIDQFAGFVGRIAAAQTEFGVAPEALDKFDTDQAIDEYGDFVGVPPHLIRSDDEVVEIRADRAVAKQAAQQAAANAQAAETAKTLSEAGTDEGSVLADMMRGV